MGSYRIVIDAVGGHGCDRTATEGEALHPVAPQHLSSCPDCMARDFVARLKAAGQFGNTPASATLTHWPGDTGQVVDDLLNGTRLKGQF